MDRERALVCPKCGSMTGFRKLEVDDGGTGCLMLILGGIIPYLIFSSSRENKVVCTKCGYAFSPGKAVKPRDYLVASMIVLILFGLIVVAWFLMNY